MSIKRFTYLVPLILALLFSYSLFNNSFLEYILPFEENINGYNLEEDTKLTEVIEKAECTDSDTLQQDILEAFSQSGSLLKESANIPTSMDIDLQYTRYLPSSYEYFIILSSSAAIRSRPDANSESIATMPKYSKLNYVQTAKDGWCKVSWNRNGKIISGYIHSSKGEKRFFNFKDMESYIKKLQDFVSNNKIAYIANKKNINGRAPLCNGKEIDKYGMRRYQSAPAYSMPDNRSDFRYLVDGTLVAVQGKAGAFYKVKSITHDKIYFVPQKYISFKNSLTKLGKVIVVDRANQNQGAFEIRNGRVTLISYTFATTGTNSKYKLETPLGYYMVMEKKKMFEYLKDGTKEIEGYAPYAVRFSGGGFIHGVPVSYKKINNKLVDPGQREYLATIGSIPRSHKCVRNYTSHAKFIYNWIEIGKSAMIVIQ